MRSPLKIFSVGGLLVLSACWMAALADYGLLLMRNPDLELSVVQQRLHIPPPQPISTGEKDVVWAVNDCHPTACPRELVRMGETGKIVIAEGVSPEAVIQALVNFYRRDMKAMHRAYQEQIRDLQERLNSPVNPRPRTKAEQGGRI